MSDLTPQTSEPLSEYPKIPLYQSGHLLVEGVGVVTHVKTGHDEVWDIRDPAQKKALEAFLTLQRRNLVAGNILHKATPSQELTEAASKLGWLKLYCCTPPESLDPAVEYMWETLAVGFFLGAGHLPRDAHRLAAEVPH